MYQKIKNLFVRNLPWKALSVLIAFILWLVYMNINNPSEIKTFSLTINTENVEELAKQNLTILNLNEIEETKIELKISATRKVLDELTKMFANSEIKAYLDISTIQSMENVTYAFDTILQIKTTLTNLAYPNNNFEILSFTPTSINVKIDTTETAPKKVYVKTVGEVSQGYQDLTPEISAEYVNVYGAKTIIDSIAAVYVEVNISDKSETTTYEVTPKAYDEEGNILTDVTFDLETISVTIPITKKGTIKINEPSLTGELNQGYFIENITYSPTTIDVIGEDLENLSSISIPSIDISNLTESKSYSFSISDILKGYDLTLLNSNEDTINVYIEVGTYASKTLTFNSSNLNIVGANDKYIEVPETFDIIVSGKEEDLESLDTSKITATINLNDIEVGTNTIEVLIDLPLNITLKEKVYVEIEVNEFDIAETESITEDILQETES